MIPKPLKFLIIALSCFSLLLILAPAVQAQTFLPACIATGYCSLCDVMQVFINFGKFLLGIVGSLALLMFVYGGFTWLTSGGESGKIDAGKKILVNSVIGIAITFFAWVVVSFVVTVLTESTGWQWNITLTCADMPQLPPPHLENRWDDGGLKEGDACNNSSSCGSNMFCNDTGKCQNKLTGGITCFGKSIEAKKLADQNGYDIAGTAAAIVVTGVAPVIIIGATIYFHASDVACLSDDCNMVNRNGVGKCDAPAEGTGTIALGGDCNRSTDCAGGYCAESDGKCTQFKDFGEACDGLAEDYDNYVCAGASEMAKCDSIGNNACVPGKRVGAIGIFCTESNQCQKYDAYDSTGLFCAADGWNPNNTITSTHGGDKDVGTCQPKGVNNAYCEGWEVNSASDQYVCQSGPGKCTAVLLENDRCNP